MGLRILYDHDEPAACLWDSVSGRAFGPVFEGDTARDDAQAFIDWLPLDARTYGQRELESLHTVWSKMREAAKAYIISPDGVPYGPFARRPNV